MHHPQRKQDNAAKVHECWLQTLPQDIANLRATQFAIAPAAHVWLATESNQHIYICQSIYFSHFSSMFIAQVVVK
jgi:hypothetical protein